VGVLEDNTKICGVCIENEVDNLVGEEIELIGDWATHKTYGIQFEFESLSLNQNELLFFFSKIVKGLGKTLAKKILDRYTEDEIYDILDNNPKELLKIQGIKEKKLAQIVNSWNKYKHLRELSKFLGELELSVNLINKIYQELGEIENLAQKIQTNPYILTKVSGIGFKRADIIAQKLGIEKENIFRIETGILYVIDEFFNNEGNSSIEKEKLIEISKELLEVDESLIQKQIEQLILKELLKNLPNEKITTPFYFHIEKKIIEFFEFRKNIKFNKITSNLDKFLEEKEAYFGFRLSKEQKEALSFINEGTSTLLLIGYAGTGKSTSSKALLSLLNEVFSYNDIFCVALSGIAAQRIYDTTGYSSSTIQSLLVKYKEKDFLPYKVILLDEASMVNSLTFYQLIKKISDESIFIIVGDDGQLPPIGAGEVFKDLIEFDLAKKVKLTKIYRQNQNQAIALIANEIRKAKVPEYKNDFKDFKFIDISIKNYYKLKNKLTQKELNKLRWENNQKILAKIIEISSNYILKYINLINQKQISKALTLIQIITPIKAGILGVENLNKELQILFNKQEISFEGKIYNFKLGDKVLHTKNENMKVQTLYNYKNKIDEFDELRIFNGMLGLIIKIDKENEQLIVLYPNDEVIVFYDFSEVDNLLSLAYALTIHKTQGMEYNSIIIPMSLSHYIMLNSKLLYTAITRAKKMCYIIGESQAFESGAKRLEITQRSTVIKDLLS